MSPSGSSDPGRVRPATPLDRRALARLRWEWRLAWGEEPTVSFEEFADDFGSWLDQRRASHLGFVAEVSGEAVGMGVLAIVERVPGPGDWTRLGGYVQSLYVDPAHRGQGLGQTITAAIVSQARERGLRWLAVHPSERSMPLYRRAGFAQRDRLLELRFGPDQ